MRFKSLSFRLSEGLKVWRFEESTKSEFIQNDFKKRRWNHSEILVASLSESDFEFLNLNFLNSGRINKQIIY